MDSYDIEWFWGKCSKPAQPSGVRQFKSGMVGVARGQTVRINVVNTAAEPSSLAKTAWIQGWGNPRSEMLQQATFTLEAGASVFTDLNGDAIVGHKEVRHEIRAEVTILNDPNSACAVTMEVFDNDSGKTTVLAHLAEACATTSQPAPAA